jgi:hypothetical protein
MSNVNDDDSPRDGESVTVEESRSWLGRLGQSFRKAARLPKAAPAT